MNARWVAFQERASGLTTRVSSPQAIQRSDTQGLALLDETPSSEPSAMLLCHLQRDRRPALTQRSSTSIEELLFRALQSGLVCGAPPLSPLRSSRRCGLEVDRLTRLGDLLGRRHGNHSHGGRLKVRNRSDQRIHQSLDGRLRWKGRPIVTLLVPREPYDDRSDDRDHAQRRERDR